MIEICKEVVTVDSVFKNYYHVPIEIKSILWS